MIDATYTPVNHYSSDAVRNDIILRDFPGLVEDLRKHTGPETGIVLVKANVCELLEARLVEQGFMVLNRGAKIPFPSHGWQNRFAAAIRRVLEPHLI